MTDPQHFHAIAVLVAQQSTASTAASLIWVGAIIAVVRRKHAIGGWLFFFFWQVVAGCAVTIAYTDWSRYTPRTWRHQVQYFAFVLATGPRVAILVTIAVVGVMLMRTYEWRWVIVLRYALVIFAIFGCFSVGADFLYFPERVATDVGSLIFPVAYAIYFNISTRVRSVFQDRVWNGRAVGVAS
jgi:hypothetical protein